MSKQLQVNKAKCATCPWREGSPYAYLRNDLECSAMRVARICHSTGKDNAINKRTGKPEAICRGARDFQLQVLHGIGFLPAATDEAWNAKAAQMGIIPNRQRK